MCLFVCLCVFARMCVFFCLKFILLLLCPFALPSPSICHSVRPFPIHLIAYLSVRASVHLSTWLSFLPFISPPIQSSVYSVVLPSFRPFIHLPIHPIIHPPSTSHPVHTSIHLLVLSSIHLPKPSMFRAGIPMRVFTSDRQLVS